MCTLYYLQGLWYCVRLEEQLKWERSVLPAILKYELAGSALMTASSVALSRALKQTELWITPRIHIECKKPYGESTCPWVCTRRKSAMEPLPVLTNTSAYMLGVCIGSQLCSSAAMEHRSLTKGQVLILIIWTNQDLICQIPVSLCNKKAQKRVGEGQLVFLHGAHF